MAAASALKIDSIESLQAHLQGAIELEHATIPLYLTALYSIREGTNLEAAALLRSIVMEEMLHMSLAANLLIAVGGEPKFNHEEFIQKFPGFLRYSDDAVELRLRKLSEPALELFMQIERPATPEAPPQADEFQTIAQFYLAIADGLRALCGRPAGDANVFRGGSARQIGAEQYYGSGGRLFTIHGLEDALRAIAIIVDQGEGLPGHIADGDHLYFDQPDEPAHYFKFVQIRRGRYYSRKVTPRSGPSGRPLAVDFDCVHDMAPDPSLERLPPGTAQWRRSLEFASLYCSLLDTLHEAFNGHPGQFDRAIAMMYALKYSAQALMQIRLPGSVQTCGPCFEYVPPDQRLVG